MYATLIGTDRETEYHLTLFEKLCRQAGDFKFTASENELEFQSDQQGLEEWNLKLWCPETKKADFFLAVTYPKTPFISPIPIKNDIQAPSFFVVIQDGFFGVKRTDYKDYIEYKTEKELEDGFRDFLETVRDLIKILGDL